MRGVREVIPAYHHERALRWKFFGDDIDSMPRFDPLTARCWRGGPKPAHPASYYVSARTTLTHADDHRVELARGLTWFQAHGKLVVPRAWSKRTQLAWK